MRTKGLTLTLALFLMVLCSSTIAFADFVWEFPGAAWVASDGDLPSQSVGDLNNDGYPDVVLADNSLQDDGLPEIFIYYNDAGQLPDAPSLTIADYSWQAAYPQVELADMNGDGWLDIVALQGGRWNEVGGFEPGFIEIYINDNGYFNSVPDKSLRPYRSGFIKIADIDSDGDADLLVNSGYKNTGMYVFLNNGGELTYATSLVPFWSQGPIDVVDYDDDGIMEVVIANVREDEYYYRRTFAYKYDSTSQSFDYIWVSAYYPRSVVASIYFVDYDNDGDLDLINNFGQINENIDGALSSEPITYEGGGTPNGMAVGDYNNDGLVDVVAGYFSHWATGRTTRFHYSENTGDGFEMYRVDSGNIITGLTNIDFDQDGDIDLLVSFGGTTARILENNVISNRQPIADAGADQTVECGNVVLLDGLGSTDPDGDALTYTWTGTFGTATGVNATVTLPLGTHTVTLMVDDGNGGTDSDEVVIAIADTTPPVITIFGISDGETYTFGLVPEASYDVMDTCSGVASSSALLVGGGDICFDSFTYKVTATDNAGNEGTETATYEVIATADGLIALIHQMVLDGLIAPEMENSLVSKLQNGAFKAFINQVEAQTRSDGKNNKKIDPAAAAMLISAGSCF